MLLDQVHSENPLVNPLNVTAVQEAEQQKLNQNAIGTKNGTVPIVNSQSSDHQNSPEDPLEQWKKVEDNNQNQNLNNIEQNNQNNNQNTNQNTTQNQNTTTPVVPIATKAKEVVLPTAEQFSQVAQQVGATIKPIDAELAAKVLGGDVEALQQLMSSHAQDIIGKTLHASTVANNALQKSNNDFNKETIQNDVVEQQYKETATRSAIAELPSLNTGMNTALLETAINHLRTTHPGAPAQELGKEAARQLGLQLNIGQEDQNATTSEMDWGKEFANADATLVT